MFATIYRSGSAARLSSSVQSRLAPPVGGALVGFWKMMLACSEVAVRHNYSAPWLHGAAR